MKLSLNFKKIWPYLTLIILGFLLYCQTLAFSYSYLDDNNLILDNQKILHEAGLAKIFTSDVFFYGAGNGFYYRPLLNVSFLLDSLFGGTNPFFFHLTNLILHLIAACLVFLVFKKYFLSRETSYFLALVFLTHPVLSQAVAWIPGRNDSLLTIFVLASFYFFLKFLRNDKIAYLWGHIVFFTLALFVKETAVFLPLVCLIYYFLSDYKFSKENRQDNFLLTLALWFGAALVWYLFRTVSLPDNSLSNLALVGWHNLGAVLIYFGKIILPFNLGVYPTMKDSFYQPGALAFLIFCLALYFTPKLNWRRFSFGLLWFIIFLIPTLLNSDPSLEHRLYLPLIGLLLCLSEIYPLRDVSWSKKLPKIMAAVIIIILASLTLVHCRHFSDRISFWSEAVLNSPHSAFVHNNLGAMYYLAGDLSKAKTQYQEALKLDPKQNLVHNNLGLIAASAKDFREAESEYRQELEINPGYDNAWANLGILYFNLKRLSEAKAAFAEAYRLNPNNQQAYNSLRILGAN
ncbi:MAG: tetratricopeptide repeat protein [Candidatus Falkowbacteria bacterium]